MASQAGRIFSVLVLAAVVAVSAAVAVGSSSEFDIDNAIRYVTDLPQHAAFESALFQAVGNARHAFAFARFVRRWRNHFYSYYFYSFGPSVCVDISNYCLPRTLSGTGRAMDLLRRSSGGSRSSWITFILSAGAIGGRDHTP